MGANVSKTVEKISNTIINEIDQSSGASSTVNCAVKTGNINLRNSKRSSVINENRCGASASAAMEATVEAAAKALAEASTEQKTKLLPGVNASSTDLETRNLIRNQLKQKCQANSSAALEIATGDINIDGSEDCHIKNINFGDVVSNCGIKTVIKAALDAEVKGNTSQSTGSLLEGLGLDMLGTSGLMASGGSILISSLCCCCCIILIIAAVMMTMK